MNAKTLIIGIAGGIVVFLTGFLIYGILMMEYFVNNTNSFPGFNKDPMEIWAIASGNIIWGVLLSYVFNLGEVEFEYVHRLTGASKAEVEIGGKKAEYCIIAS